MYNNLCRHWQALLRNGSMIVYYSHVALCAINGFLSLLAVTGNIVVVLAVKNLSSARTPSLTLLKTLFASDLGIGLVVQPLYILGLSAVFSEVLSKNHCHIAAAHLFTAILFGFVSLGTNSIISADRLLALHLKIRYRSAITTRRVTIAITAVWLLAFILAIMALTNARLYFLTESSIVLALLLFTTASYFQTNRKFLRAKKATQGQCSTNTNHAPSNRYIFNTSKYQHSLYSMMYVYAAFLVCYTPFFLYRVVFLILGYNTSTKFAGDIFLTIVFLNSSVNPILYYWRIPQLRRAVRRLISLSEKNDGTPSLQ